MSIQRDRTQTVNKSSTVELLSQVEGYEDSFYTPGNPKSGATIGNGIDFGQHNEKDLVRMGVPAYLVDKIREYKLLGVKGEQAKRRLMFLESNNNYQRLSSGEVATISNIVTNDTMNQVISKVGEEAWNDKPEGGKAAALSLYHLYGGKWFQHNSFKQFDTNDWDGMKANMENYGDRTPGLADGVNKRHRQMSMFIPSTEVYMAAVERETREEEMARLAAEKRKEYDEGVPFQADPTHLYQTDTGVQAHNPANDKPVTGSPEDIATDPFYQAGGSQSRRQK